MNRWMLFVARRFLGTRQTRGAGATGLAVAGIAAGVATLIVVLAVMNGFQLGTIENILEVNSFHLRLSTDRGVAEREEIAPVVEELRRDPAVESAVPTAEIQTLARGFWPEPQGIVLRAVPENWLARDRGAAEQLRIVSGAFEIADPRSVVLGAELARALGVRVGDSLAVTHIPRGSSRPAEVELTVQGLFRTGYLDFDRGWAFTSLSTAETSLDATDSLIVGVKLTNRFQDAEAAQRLRSAIPAAWSLENWREYNSGIFGALRVEKAMMVFLVALIFVVVAGNIFQLLRRSILERSEEIAILRALGARQGEIRRVFALEGWYIGIVGTAVGTLVGLLIAGNINEIFGLLESLAGLIGNNTPLAFSPAFFYLESVPARILPGELVLVGAGAVGWSAASSWLAGRSAVRRMPMDLLRSE
ncbi:MAG: ABC transporter permease [Alkalispirochaeta sp.]